MLKSEAWNEGYNAFNTGWDPEDCPYVESTHEYEEWFDGYDAAYADSQDR